MCCPGSTVEAGSPIRATTYRPPFSVERSTGTEAPSMLTERSCGVRRACGALGSERSKKRKMPCLPASGNCTVIRSVVLRSPFAATVKSAR